LQKVYKSALKPNFKSRILRKVRRNNWKPMFYHNIIGF